MAKQTKRFRLSVPEEDITVAEWLNSQINYSNSIRLLIREDILRNGYSDVSCRYVGKKSSEVRPRRVTQQKPTNQAKIVEEDVVEEKVIQPPKQEVVQPINEGDDTRNILESILG